jgi:cholesterol oxidase
VPSARPGAGAAQDRRLHRSRAAQPHGAATQLPCDYSGNCGFGCAAAAKNTLDLNYLPLAERHGPEIHALHHVDCIAPLRRGGYRVDFQHMLPQAPSAPERGSVRAGTVVVAAGTLGTNELLLRCRDQHATLPRLGPTLGHGFSGNGDMLLAGALTDHDIESRQGPEHHVGRRLLHRRATDLRRGPRSLGQ